MEVEPLDQVKLEDVGLDTCNHDIPLSSREVSSFDEPELQPQPLPNCPSLDVSLRDERGPEPSIKPHSPDSFRMKEVDHLTIHTPPSSHVASFYPMDVYCYYHSCIDDPKKHYGFKPGLLGSLTKSFSNSEVIEYNFLGEGLSLPIKTKELENENRVLDLRRIEEKSLIYNTSFLGEYECSSLALDRGKKKVEYEIGSLETRLNYVRNSAVFIVKKTQCLLWEVPDISGGRPSYQGDAPRQWRRHQNLLLTSSGSSIDGITTTCDSVPIANIKKPLEDSTG
ncbi:hypothetical protein Tco_0497764 [Tanacetum coccineum]